MSYAIIAFFVLALIHFIYESILAPSFRQELRLELAVQQQRLRDLRRTLPGAVLQEKHHRYLQDSINGLSHVLDRYDWASLRKIEVTMVHNPALRRLVDERSRAMEDCTLPAAKEIRAATYHVARRALLVNNFFLLAGIIPLAQGLSYFSKLKERYAALVCTSISLPEKDLQRVAPSVP